MVYTKHFVIHTVKHLNQAEEYVENASKTLIEKQEADESHLDNIFPYVMNDDKTLSKQLVSGHGIIDVNNAANEFIATKERAEIAKGTNLIFDPKTKKMIFDRKSIEAGNGRGKAVLAHHLIQSFSPDDNLTPEQIHEIGRQTVLEFTGGEYEFVIATHVDKAHIHNHIVLNSTNIMTGKAMEWKIVKLKNGQNKDKQKEAFEKISDKIASKYGAKIIEKSPKNSHKKYTMWQTESIFKQKIKSRLDFLLDHSSTIDDFLLKAEALDLSVDFSKKWATFRLLDEPQFKNTRGRNLMKNDPTRYNYDRIIERLSENEEYFSLEDVVARYEEKTTRQSNDFDYQLTIEPWQVSHKTEKGYYLNVDFGYENHGKLFIGAYKVDALEDGNFNIYVKRNDFFYFMDDRKAGRNRYMTGETLIKQLRLYNGSTPLKKEPVMRTIDELVDAINFLAENEVTEGRQLEALEEKLENAFHEAHETLAILENKMIELNNLGKLLLDNETDGSHEIIQGKLKEIITDATLTEMSFEDIQDEIASISASRQILESKLDQTVKEMNQLHEIQAVAKNEQEKRPTI
ncbi:MULTISPECIES: relaxase/mobilization nuclease domain-containing protein [unclassified Enterococcus]|uniref:relaxase/mobilization nuclease domain-containing protein n=1 Tax=unclassified Enterococcus TaxID=2608891 RepID=UPI001CE0A4C5|nr:MULTISPECIES: relaxase/mobilization nuclease domain-containing protein [unclassified Enterococcus]MCA5014569.1 relaxase/mobilization nuclease domain-containing protein [Enterococcus sp. S23]MCA5017822.1 relaxase/mobilization nuclease domain-containing protein [Enterococcus sp. S22(2020)]